MSHPSRVKGSRFEHALLDYFLSHKIQASLLAPAGRLDQGDLVLDWDGVPMVVEAKAEKRIDLPEYLRQLEAEVDHYRDRHNVDPVGIVVVKRRNAPIGQSYVVSALDKFFGFDS
jgi:hypothetical protein